MVRFFIGKVESVDETFHTIKFSMEDFTNSAGIAISAVPLVPTTVLPEQDDEVLIIQPNSGVEIFYYSQMPNPSEDSTKVELRYGTAYVKIEKSDGKYTITADTSNSSSAVLEDSKVTLKAGNSEIEMTSSKVTINGHLEIT